MDNSTLALCKRLRDAGFPQGGNGLWWIENNYKKANPDVINASWQYKKQLFSVGLKDNISGFFDVTKRFPFPEYSIIAYEPTPIELEEAVIEEARKKANDREFIEFNTTWVEKKRKWKSFICWDFINGRSGIVATNRFIAIAELWLRIRGIR